MRSENREEHPNALLKQIGEDRSFFRRSGEGRGDRMKFAGDVAGAIDVGRASSPTVSRLPVLLPSMRSRNASIFSMTIQR